MIVQLENKQGAPLAYLNKNAIRDFRSGKVLGVILGKCVFNQSGKVIGSLHHGKVRNEHGELIAVISLGEPRWSLTPAADSSSVWEMITHIKDHGCLQIEKERDWSSRSLEEVLI